MKRLVTRLQLATLTWPDTRGWRDMLLILLGWFAVALLIGRSAGFLRWGWSESSVSQLIWFGIIASVVPCLIEELVFRVLPLPHPQENTAPWKRWCAASLALLVFIAWHPLNGWLWKVSAWSIFIDPAFLCLAGLLGMACTMAYLRTGSVWPAVAIHWLTLMVWKVCLGGRLIPIGT